MSTDPVCGMEVHEPLAAATVQHGGETFYFCSARCLGKFQDDPAAYLEEQPPQATANAA
jgi:Cu+-exporting ATPase